MRVYGRDGLPIDASTCERLLADPEYRQVEKTIVHTDEAHYMVSTVWLGIDHNLTPGEHVPIIFETLVFKLGNDGWTGMAQGERYSSLTEAQTGHQRHIRALTP